MPTAMPRKNDVLAANVLFGGLAFSIIIDLVRVLVLHRVHGLYGTATVLGAIVGCLLCIAIYSAIRRGRPWGKIAQAVLFTLTIVFSLFYHKTTLYNLRTDVLYAVNYVVGYLV